MNTKNLALIAGAAAAVVIIAKFKDLKSVGAGIGGAAVDVVDGLDVVDDLMVEDQMGDATPIQPMHTMPKCRLR